jgi:hypothetical protein
MAHKHRAIMAKREEWGYTQCHARYHDECNYHAHGMVCYVDVCSCGAKRHSNHNMTDSEYGWWCNADGVAIDGDGEPIWK